jgi:hypothetical protein
MTIFCDDIRTEIGGKITYVGTYRQTIFIHEEFPATLPKFCFAVSYFEDPNDLPSHLELRVFFPGDGSEPSIAGELELPGQAKPIARLPEGSGPSILGLHANIVLAPLVIKSEGKIQVRVLRDGREISVGALLVLKAPQEQA